jgi:hypothetical protein
VHPLLEGTTHHRLDDCLPTDVQSTRFRVEFLQHFDGEVDIHPLNVRPWKRRHHPPFAREVARHIFASFGRLSELLG